MNLALLKGIFAGLAGSMILAETIESSATDKLSMAAVAVAALAALIWIVKKLVGETIPNMSSAHQAAVTSITTSHAEAVNRISAGFSVEMSDARKRHDEDRDRLLDAFKAEQGTSRAMYQSEFALQRQSFEATIDKLTGYRKPPSAP